MNQVDPADWLQYLTPLLGPKSIGLFSQMDGVETGEYEQFKEAPLPTFELTPEAYGKRFQAM